MAHMQKNEQGVWYLADDWYIEDVQNVRPDLDDDQAMEVLNMLEQEFDANNGINWEVIEYTAEALYPPKED